MSVAKHSPGPWEAFPGGFNDAGYDVYDADGNFLTTDIQVHVANARLIAAAPDLLEAAQGLGSMPWGYCFCSKDRIGDDSKVHEPECRDLRAAIAKAEGKQ